MVEWLGGKMDLTTFSLLVLMAICGGVADVVRKELLAHMSPYQALLCMYGFFALPAAVFVLWRVGVPDISPEAYVPWGVFVLLISPLLFTFYKALQITKISLVAPVFALVPLATLIGETAFLDTKISVLGAVGIGVVVFGAYGLRVTRFEDGWLAPIKALARERGMRYGVIALVLWGIIVPHQRLILDTFQGSLRRLVGGLALLILSEALTHLVVFSTLHLVTGGRHHTTPFPWRQVGVAGTLWVAHVFLLYWGFFATSISYAMAMRSMSVLVAVYLAWRRLGEDPRPQLPGIVVMLVGIVIICLWGAVPGEVS